MRPTISGLVIGLCRDDRGAAAAPRWRAAGTAPARRATFQPLVYSGCYTAGCSWR